MNTIYPTNQETEKAICGICDRGLKKPVSLATFIRDMVCNLGIKYIFHGTYDVVIVSAAVFFFACLGLCEHILFHSAAEAWLYTGMFAVAPLLTMLLFSLSFWKEHDHVLYEQKMVCRYTAAHLLAFRMMAASVLGFVSTTGYILSLCLRLQAPVLRILSVAYASLLLFSILMTQAILVKGTLRSLFFLNLAWILGNGLACAFFVERYALLLKAVPVILWVAVDLLLAVILLQGFRVYVRRACYACG